MTKSQTPEPTVPPTPDTRDTPARELPTEGNLARQPTAPLSQGESKPRRFFKVRTDHH